MRDARTLTWFLLAAALLPPGAARAVDCVTTSGSGVATNYNYVPGTGNCSFDDDGGALVAAINPVDYAGSKLCGAWLRVQGSLGAVLVRVVDQCPSCAAGDLDLNAPAFAAIADPKAGSAPFTWTRVVDSDPGAIFVQQSAGTNAFFLQVQPRDGRYAFASVEYLGPSGYVAARRETYNYFTVDGSLGVPVPLPSPFTLRVTDLNGQPMVIPAIPLAAGHVHATGQQFPYCVPLAVPPSGAPRGVALVATTPNPFHHETTLEFELAHDGDVRLRLYDAGGRRVRTLIDAALPAGRHHVTWNGLDDAGRRLPAGLYFCRLAAGAAIDQRRI